jgi:hypothetical protein
MIQNLFPSQIWKSSLNIEDNILNDILNQIKFDYENNQSHLNQEWNCNIKSSFNNTTNIDYSKLFPYFIGEYLNFCGQLGLKKHTCSIDSIWYNYYTKGSNQEIHSHVFDTTIYSAVFFLKLNKNHPLLTFYNYTNFQSFFDINTKIKNLYDLNNIDHSIVCPHYSLDVNQNDFVIFPSYVPHGVFVQENDEPRITISLNFNLK